MIIMKIVRLPSIGYCNYRVIRRTIFFKKVKGITGFSPNELIKMKRLNKAAVLLRQGEFTVSEVSYKVGFEDPFYFSKCFKAHFDCTPKNYKKSI